LRLDNGQVRSRRDGYETAPTVNKHFGDRRRGFDLDTYDRLTVLTQEIRRLVRDDRAVRLVVEADVVLYADKLRTMLRWI
jgi:hypothetical protein